VLPHLNHPSVKTFKNLNGDSYAANSLIKNVLRAGRSTRPSIPSELVNEGTATVQW
jgi:hypothetical protein